MRDKYISKEEIEMIDKREIGSTLFRELYLNDPDVHARKLDLDQLNAQTTYGGVDFASGNDKTVISMISNNEQFMIDQFDLLDYQKELLRNIYQSMAIPERLLNPEYSQDMPCLRLREQYPVRELDLD